MTPEGFDDLVLDGDGSVDIQVKSRVEHLGAFPPRLAARHVIEAWGRHVGRPSPSGRLAVVLERGVEGEGGLSSFTHRVSDTLGTESEFRRTLVAIAADEGMTDVDVGAMLDGTAVLGISWYSLAVETAASIRVVAELAPSALELVAQQLRVLIAEASDANVVRDYDSRRVLTKTEVIAEISRVASQIDIDALELAVREGICEPFELAPTGSADDRFYEGVATQPFHVAAGLVVPRPDLVGEVLSGLDEQSAVVITGPSGVGKSALLWMVPLAAPGVLWFRVRRLAEADVPAIIRLARAYRASERAPVGFLIDGVGVGDIRGWAHLRAEATAVPGLLMLGTARTEDLPTLGNLAGCATVKVALNDAEAAVIFDGLVRRGSTTSAHWREAFDQSNGLTLEFTHLLCRGERLADVIQDQVDRRIDEGRLDEVDVLSLVAVADQWGAALPAAEVGVACGASALELRQAVRRLTDEHLVVERDGVISGLHQLRSAALSAAIHESPPPDLTTTVRRVLELVPAGELHRFVAGALTERAEVSDAVIEVAASEPQQPERLVAYFHALSLADFYEVARRWKEVAEAHGVPASSQALLFNFAAAGLTVPDIFPDDLRAACAEMENVSVPSRAVQLAELVGYSSLALILASCGTAQSAALLLSALDKAGPQFTAAVADSLASDSAVVRALERSSLDEVGDCLAAARRCDPVLATLLIDLLGGQAAILGRLRADDPWITALDIRPADPGPGGGPEEAVGYCRLLHVSDEVQGDPRERAVAVGRRLLRCVPSIESVDVQALLPGGQELQIGDYTHGVSGLRRQYDHTSLSVSWNQARMRAAITLLGATDTERLSAALPLLDETVRVAREAGLALVLGKASGVDFTHLGQTVSDLHERARSLRPALGAVAIGDTPIGEEASVPMGDDLSALVTDLTGNILARLSERETYRALEAYIAETTIGRHLDGAMRSPWHLLGLAGHPQSLDDLQEVLTDLHAVVHEMSVEGADLAKVGRNARSGGRDGALGRAAMTCRRSEQRRQRDRRVELQRTCRATESRASVLAPLRGTLPGATREWAIAVELASLLDWPETLASLSSVLSAAQPLGESYVLVPLRQGRPVPSLAVKQISTPLPASQIDEWASQLAEPHGSPLADSFTDAQTALQILSGLSELPPSQQEHPQVQQVVGQASEDFARARGELLGYPTDALTRELLLVVDALAASVEAQLSSESSESSDLSFAQQIAAALVQGSTNSAFDTVVGAQYLALEWDIDQHRAVDNFRSAS